MFDLKKKTKKKKRANEQIKISVTEEEHTSAIKMEGLK